MDTMDSQHYGGLSLFAVLPGPKPPPQAFEELVFTARNLSERLHGVLQDEHGSPLTAARIALLREQLRSSTAAS
jgi:FtsZ-interacting cell division protein ZipA